MELEVLKREVNKWIDWGNDFGHHDIALFKIWIQMENFINDIFVCYCLGQPSEKMYTPKLQIQFIDDSQLNAFLREGSKKYVEYQNKIEKLSKYIFEDGADPFAILNEDIVIKNAIREIKFIRNYIAHESAEARQKYKNVYSNNISVRDDKFIEPEEYLMQQKKQKGKKSKTYFSYYIDTLMELADFLIDPSFN